MENIIDIEQVWGEYRSGLKSFLHSRISNDAEVDDLLQEVLIKVHNNLYSVKSEESIKSWLYQIANHAIVDFYRKNSKLYNLQPDDLWYGEADTNTLHELEKCIPFYQSFAN